MCEFLVELFLSVNMQMRQCFETLKSNRFSNKGLNFPCLMISCNFPDFPNLSWVRPEKLIRPDIWLNKNAILLGIGNSIRESELNSIATSPNNVYSTTFPITVHFSNLSTIWAKVNSILIHYTIPQFQYRNWVSIYSIGELQKLIDNLDKSKNRFEIKT